MKLQKILAALACGLLILGGPLQVSAKPDKGKVSAGTKASGGSSKKRKSSGSSSGKQNISYEVRPGDNLGDIAKKHGVRTADIVRWNNLKSADKIRAGQKLKIRTVSGSSSSSSSRRSTSGTQQRKVIYVARKGDSVTKIAKKHGVTINQLKNWNRAIKKNPDQVRVGQKIALWVNAPGNESASIGMANRGKLANAELLPNGNGYFRRSPKRQYGTNLTINHLMTVFAKYAAKYPKGADWVIGDLSFEDGGKMKPHKSHQSGRDVDVGYLTSDGKQLKRFLDVSEKTIDVEKTWYVLKAFIDTGDVEYIFVDYKLQKPLYEFAKKKGVSNSYLKRVFQYPSGKRSRRAIIRHSRGHDDHFHLRFNCAKGDGKCH